MIDKKVDMDVFLALVDWAEVKEAVGTPSMTIMPARNYNFKVLDGQYRISIPRKGKYVDIDPKFFSERDGEFEIFNEDSGVLYLPAITKVLFATNKYPDLASNQLFVPAVFIFREEEIIILAQVLEMKINLEEE